MSFYKIKYLVVNFVALVYSLNSFAQSATKTITIDTIHLRGNVYLYDGKPAKGIIIESKQRDLKYNRYNITAVTDSNGYFMLEGAKPRDTLWVPGIQYNNVRIQNKGARYVVIYLPKEFTEDIDEDNPVVVTAERRYPKITPSFKIEEDHMIIDGVELFASFVGGHQRFDDFLRKGLHYPQKAIDLNIEGTVQIGFDITRDGNLTNFKILKGIDYGCDEEVIKLLKASPRWRPEIVNGKPYTQHETLTVEFKLTDQ